MLVYAHEEITELDRIVQKPFYKNSNRQPARSGAAEHGSWRTYIVRSRNLATAGEDELRRISVCYTELSSV
jgi:hypothetical protein